MKTKPAIILVTALFFFAFFANSAECNAVEITALSPPVLHWAFDETGGTSAIDSTGNGNTGTLYNSPTRVTGQFDYALQFDGVNDYVYLNDLSTTISGDMSMSCWVNYTNANSAKRAIDLADFQMRFNDGKVGWDNGGGPSSETFSTAAYNDGQWHHVVFVRTGTSYQMYIDTVPDNSDTGTAPSYDWIYVGKRASGDLYIGKVDDVQIFNYALSTTDIDELFFGTGGTVNVKFEYGYSGGLETVTPAELTVVVNNAVPEHAYTVDYDVTGGTATGGGVDYTLAGDTLVFLPGDTSEIISIPIVADGTPEPDETIIVTLSNPTGIDLVLGTITSHTYTITDSTPRLSFNSASSNGSESTTAVSIPVSLSAASNDTITVDYDVTGGTATGGGTDYTLANGTLTFSPQDTSENINITIVNDSDPENAETIEITLSNPVNAQLGSTTQHNYVINDDDVQNGLMWDDLIWYYSGNLSDFFVNGDGDLQWSPEGGEQFITRIPDQSLSEVGDIVIISYLWLTDGQHNCADCFDCDLFCHDNDITCIAGTSDMRVAMCEADGEYVQDNGFAVTGSSIFNGYKGYNFRFGPNMVATSPEGLTRWVDCHDEVHKTGMFAKKPVSNSDLMFLNDGLKDRIPGFELPPGEWSKLTLSLERTSATNVLMSITLNDRTYTYVDDEPDQPSKIDVLAVHMRNHRPYNKLILSIVEHPAADFTGNCIVDACDLEVLSQDWLKRAPAPVEPDANGLVIHYTFDETSGSTAYDSANNYDGQVKFISDDTPATTAWDTAGYDANGCIDCAGDVKVVVPATAFAGIDSAVTVSLWVNGEVQQSDPYWGMAFQGANPTNYSLLFARIPIISIDGSIDVMFGSSSSYSQVLSWEGSSPSDWEGQWNHYAFILDTVLGKAQIFHNGFKKAEGPASEGVTGIQDFHVCTGFFTGGSTCEYIGKIDDFRVYDYALTENEVLYVANDGSITVPLPLDLPANLYYDNIINGKDFAEFALEWLDECQ